MTAITSLDVILYAGVSIVVFVGVMVMVMGLVAEK
jgi:hypothetical protein